jgi:YD repeat-containing protein
VIMPSGYTINYDSKGRMIKETVPGSYTVDYEYFDLTPIVKKKIYTETGTGKTITYEYDPLSRLKKEIHQDMVITFRYYGWTDHMRRVIVVNPMNPSVELLRLEYRTDGTLQKKIEPGMVSTYDVLGRIKTWEIAGISKTFVSYQGDTDKLAKKIFTDLATGNSVIYNFSADGKPETTIDLTGWHSEYDAAGRLIKEYGATQVIMYTYADAGAVNIATKRVVNKDTAEAILYTYDADGALVSRDIITAPVTMYDDDGRLVMVVYYDTSKDEYTYHGATTQVASHTHTDLEGRQTIKEYDEDGRLTREVNPNGTWIVYTYDGTGKLIRKDYQDGSFDAISYYTSGGIKTVVKTSAYNRATTETYSETTGLKTKSVTWDGKTTTYEYDAQGRLIKQTNPYGTSDSYTYHGATTVVATHTYAYGSYWYKDEYRPDGQLLKTTNYYGYTTTYTYDGLDRRISMEYSYGSYKSKTTYEYEGNTNKVIKESYYYNGTLYSWYQYEYYGATDIIKSKTYNSTYGYTYKYEYDVKTGKLVKTTSSSGDYTIYEYDSLNRLARIDSSYGYTSIYTYYGDSNTYHMITWIDNEGRTYITEYDALGKVIRSSSWYEGGDYRYYYDTFGRMTRIDYADASYSLYTYVGDYNYRSEMRHFDSSDNLIWSYSYEYYSNWTMKKYTYFRDGKTTVYEYLSDGRLNKITNEAGVTTYNYDSSKRLTSIVYPDGAHTDYEYEGTSTRTKKIAKYNADGTSSYEEWTYFGSTWRRQTYKAVDKDGNMTLYEYNYDGYIIKLTTPDGITATYTYDSNRRISRIDYSDGTYKMWTYDAQGRVSRIDYSNGNYETTTYTANGWQIDTITRYYAEDNTTYTESHTYYDGADRYTMKTTTIIARNGDRTVYHYDEEGVLTHEERPDGTTVYYSEYESAYSGSLYFNYWSGRIKRKDVSDGGYYTYEYDANGNPTETYHPAPLGAGASDPNLLLFSSQQDILNRNSELKKTLNGLGVGLSGDIVTTNEGNPKEK